MSFKEITRLRKSGKLDEAFKMAGKELQAAPNDEWCKKAIVWVYFDYLKIAREQNNFENIIVQIGNIKKLALPTSEKMAFDSVAWQVGKYLFAQKLVPAQQLNKLFDTIYGFSFTTKTDSYSYLLKAFKKHAEKWPRFAEFVNWWGYDNFMPADYLKFTLDNGQDIPPLVESVFIALSKQLLKPPIDREKIEGFIPKISAICTAHPKMQYPPYYHAKLMIALGDKKEFLKAFVPFAKKKRNDFWVWDLMSEAFSITDEKYIACISRSLLCNAPGKFMVNVHEKMAGWLIANKMYREAKYEIQKVINIRTQNEWKVPRNLLEHENAFWWNNSETVRNNTKLYEKYAPLANNILLGNLPAETVVIDFVNTTNKTASFLAENRKTGIFNYSRLPIVPKTAQFYTIRFFGQNSKKSTFYKVATIQEITAPVEVDFVKTVEGNLSVKQGNSFGFLRNTFVPPQIVAQYSLCDGSHIKAKAIESYNKNRKTWGWKVVEVVE